MLTLKWKIKLLIYKSRSTLTYLCPFASFKIVIFFLGGANGKESACQSRRRKRLGLIPESGICTWMNMATHSSILDWQVPWREESGRL